MTRIRWSQAALLLLGGLGACGLVTKPEPVEFSHELHVNQEGVECESCHGEIAEAGDLRTRHLPTAESCAECHEDDAGSVAAQAMASYRPPRIYVPTFSHADHLEADEIDGKCGGCHAMTARAGEAGANRHKMCMSCHREEFRDASCRVCHADFSERAPFPERYFAHGGDFDKRHASVARGNEGVCDHCHRESDCASCHSRHIELVPSQRDPASVEAGYVHRAGFVVRHAIEARQDQTRCLKCHRPEGCTECHTERGVAGAGLASRHPAGWMDPAARTFHGRKARHEIALCASCHDRGAQSNCVACHRVGGVGGNPHPAGWDSRLERTESPACRACHSR